MGPDRGDAAQAGRPGGAGAGGPDGARSRDAAARRVGVCVHGRKPRPGG